MNKYEGQIKELKTKNELQYKDIIFKSNNYGDFKIIGSLINSNPKKYICQFIFNNAMTAATIGNIKKGEIRNKYMPQKAYHGGCLGELSKKHVLYPRWQQMLNRCYDINHAKYKTYGGNDVVVCDRWKVFEYYVEDIESMDNYSDENISNLDVDKDIKIKGNKLYSKDTCILVDRKINTKEMNDRRTFQFKAINIDSCEEYIVNTSINQFARDNELHSSCITKCLQGKQKTHKGWEFVKI